MKILAGDWNEGGTARLKKTLGGRVTGLVLQSGMLAAETVARAQVASVEEINQENSASVLGKAAWGAAGAALLGPVGLLAGALAGGNRQLSVLAIEFKDERRVLVQAKQSEANQIRAMAF